MTVKELIEQVGVAPIQVDNERVFINKGNVPLEIISKLRLSVMEYRVTETGLVKIKTF